MTDPIGAMINEIKVAGMAKKPSVSFRYSKIKDSILECLKKGGFVGSVDKKVKQGHTFLDVEVFYEESGLPKIKETRRISKPSRRMYMGYREIRQIKGGRGLIVLSTPKGILSGEEAKKELVGGEPLFWVW